MTSSVVIDQAVAALDRDHPFPGLRAYEEADAAWFFGRGREINELLKRLRRVRFLAVVGPSGCGKSSLIKAGVLPAVRDGYLDAAWEIAILRPGERPLDNLAAALSLDSADPSELRKALDCGPMSLTEAMARRQNPKPTNVLILVDQFEELFQYVQRVGDSAQEEAKQFLKLLLTAAASDLAPVYIVLTMRLEWLNECATYTGLAEAINEGIYLVPQPSRRQFQQVILGPIEAAGGSITSALLDRLLNDLDSRTDQLPVLQHALMRMWEQHPRDSLDVATYEAKPVETLAHCLSNHAEEFFDTFSPAEKRAAELLFRSITQVFKGRKMRRPRPLGEVADSTGASMEDLEHVVKAFREQGRSFVVTTPGDLNRESIVDISHEALIRQWVRLCEWVDDEAELQAKLDRLESVAAEWDKERHGSALYRGWFLKQAERELRPRVQADSVAARFLQASRRADRRRRMLLIGSVVLFLVVVLGWLGTLAVQQQRELIQKQAAAVRDAANAQKLAEFAQQQTTREQQYQDSLKVLLSTNNKPSATTYASIVRTIQGKRIYVQYVGNDQLNIAKEVQAYFTSQSYSVPGCEKVAQTKAPHQLQIRYFHQEDQPDAEKIKDLLANIVAGNAAAAQTADPHNLVPSGQFEIWLPAGSVLNYGGTWVQTDEAANPKMRMKIAQNGNQLTIWLSYSDAFGSQPFGQATVEGNKAGWTLPQGCAPQYQKAGYDYSNPGTNTFTLELKGSALTYTQQTNWTSPCDGHPIGTEALTKNMQRSE